MMETDPLLDAQQSPSLPEPGPSLFPGDGFPVLPGGNLAQVLAHLLRAARHHVALPLSLRPRGDLVEALDAMVRAAAAVPVGKASLGDLLWTRSGPFWNGEIASRLEGPDAQGFLLLCAMTIGRDIIFFRRGRPLRTLGPIKGARAAQGPYLVLLRCARGADGKAVALDGAAQAIESGLGLVIGHYPMDVFGEPALSPQALIEVDFLNGHVVRGKASDRLSFAAACFADILPEFCQRNGAEVTDFKALSATFNETPLGRRVLLSVTDQSGRSSTTEYRGVPLKRHKISDSLGRIRKSPRDQTNIR